MEEFLQNPDWRFRQAAMWTLSQVGEVCQEDDLAKALALAVHFFGDPHPRVRYAAINAIGQLSRDHAPSVRYELNSLVSNAYPQLA
jgi:HEAT repeat protein